MFGTPSNKRPMAMDFGSSGDSSLDRKKKRKSRWAQEEEDKTVILGMPTVIPNGLNKDQETQYLLHLQIEEISRRLRTGDLGISPNPEDRSPSPEPIYNNEGKRLNTREYRTRKKLEEERHRLVQEAMDINTDYKPPADYKPPVVRVSDKVMIPQDDHPEINFVGLLIGPRGNTLKNLEKDTGAKIIIRGKGSVKEGKIGRKDGQPLPGEDEPLHAYVTANNPENVKKAVEKIKDIITQGIEVPEGQNDLRRQQLRELALLNGTLRENDGLAKLKQIQQAQTIITNTILCTVCGGTGHLSQDCKAKRPGDTLKNFSPETVPPRPSQADKAKMDSEEKMKDIYLTKRYDIDHNGPAKLPTSEHKKQEEKNYMSLMAELGEGPPPPKPQSTPTTQFIRPETRFQAPPPMSQPPPNPMGINPPWQQSHMARPPPPQVVSNISLSSPVQPPPQQVQAPLPPSSYGVQSTISSTIPQQGHMQMPPHIPAPVAPPSQFVSSNAPVPPPWQQSMTSQAPSSGLPPPASLLSAPPPPPPNSQPPPSWMQIPQGAGVPPPPPITSTSASPWQQAPPPPPSSMPPWQQAPPPVQPPIPNPVAPPPPPPNSQGYSHMSAPPPPPPGGFDISAMGGVNPLLVTPPPPPPS